MSETPAISRSPSAEEFARRMRMIGQPAPAASDPFAELARLVGKEDPFKGLFPQEQSKAAANRPEPTFADPPVHAEAPQPSEPYAMTQEHRAVPEHYEQSPAEEDFAAFDHEFRGAFDPSDQPGAPVEPAVVHGPAGYYADHDGEPGAYQPVSVGDHHPVETSPDAWAQGDAEAPVVDGAERLEDRQGLEPANSGSLRRTLVVLTAVVVLTAGGLAASFLARPSRAASALVGAPPTIMAATGPTKVQPPAPVNGDDGASEPSTLLDKNKNDGTATAKVVNSIEQPVDLTQAAKPAQPAEDPRPPASSSPFPEPRKVKTVMVRPDGSIITNPADGSPLAPRLADVTGNINQEASLAFDAHTAMHQPGQSAVPATTPDPTAAPATPKPAPKTRARASATPGPQVVDETAATGPGQTQTPAASLNAKQPGAPVHVRPKPKPVEEASAAATPDSGAATTGGGYAVQLGAPPSAQEARDVSIRLQKKYADQLGAYRPAIHEGKDAGGKSVYRIRVGNLTQDDAKALCAKLQASGGACFPVRN